MFPSLAEYQPKVYSCLFYFPYRLCCSEDVEDDVEYLGDEFFSLEFLPLNYLWGAAFPRELYFSLGCNKTIYYYNKRTPICDTGFIWNVVILAVCVKSWSWAHIWWASSFGHKTGCDSPKASEAIPESVTTSSSPCQQCCAPDAVPEPMTPSTRSIPGPAVSSSSPSLRHPRAHDTVEPTPSLNPQCRRPPQARKATLYIFLCHFGPTNPYFGILHCHITLICYIAFVQLNCFNVLHCHTLLWYGTFL
jgi:hypothetical protein